MTTAFLLGFLSASTLWGSLCVAYYAHAARRVRAIRQKVRDLHAADSLVAKACDRAYSKAKTKITHFPDRSLSVTDLPKNAS